MNYSINLVKNSDKFIGKVFSKSMKDLSVFYGINWIENVPQIFVVSDRKSINLLRGKKTESWFVAWAENRTRIIYILDKNYSIYQTLNALQVMDRYQKEVIQVST